MTCDRKTASRNVVYIFCLLHLVATCIAMSMSRQLEGYKLDACIFIVCFFLSFFVSFI